MRRSTTVLLISIPGHIIAEDIKIIALTFHEGKGLIEPIPVDHAINQPKQIKNDVDPFLK
jgi:fructose-specific phosphotransferase system component IIB